MKTKRKTKYRFVFLSLALPIFLAVFFVFIQKVGALEKNIIINEIQISGGTGKTSYDYIELYNKSERAFDIGGWQLKKRTTKSDKTGYVESSIREFPAVAIIPAHGYYLWANKDADFGKIIADETSSATIAANNSIAILDKSKNIIDQVAWGSGHFEPFVERQAFFIPAGQPERIQRKNLRDTDDNSEDFQVATSGSPTASGCLNNWTDEKCLLSSGEPIIYTDSIRINELFPYPGSGQEEYIELFNDSAKDEDLAGWVLHDASKTGKYTFPVGFILEAQEYLAIFKKDFKFALNNSGDEGVTLFDPNAKEVSKVFYDGSKQNLSYSFDGSRWRWSKFLTPGEENILNSEPYGTLKIDDDVYKNVYADFAVSTGDKDGDKVKVVWDFGDGHKSYLSKTRHKYAEKGKYSVSVKLSDTSEDVLKEFAVEVKKFPHPKVSIVAVSANPKGKDSEFETLTIKNDSKKKINLEDWSIATGTKKLANHPIREKIIIKKGKTKEITRQFSSFSLNNKKAKIELRYPDGKVASKLKYDHGKVSIEEAEVYEKTKSGWVWRKVKQNTIINIQESIENTRNTINNEQTEIDNSQNAVDSVQNVKRENRILTEDSLVKIELLKSQPRVLGAETVREVGGQYFFTPQIEQKHFLILFLENLYSKVNFGINQLLNIL